MPRVSGDSLVSFKLGRSKPLARRTPLRSRSPLRSRPKRHIETPAEREARMAWCDPVAGNCSCGECGTPGRFSLRLERHHVVSKSRLKQLGRWDVLHDQQNAMLLHPDCHERHTNHSRKLRVERVSTAAMAFAVDVLGEGGAAAYFAAQYDCTVTR